MLKAVSICSALSALLVGIVLARGTGPYVEWCEDKEERKRVLGDTCEAFPFVYPFPQCYCLNGIAVVSTDAEVNPVIEILFGKGGCFNHRVLGSRNRTLNIHPKDFHANETIVGVQDEKFGWEFVKVPPGGGPLCSVGSLVVYNGEIIEMEADYEDALVYCVQPSNKDESGFGWRHYKLEQRSWLWLNDTCNGGNVVDLEIVQSGSLATAERQNCVPECPEYLEGDELTYTRVVLGLETSLTSGEFEEDGREKECKKIPTELELLHQDLNEKILKHAIQRSFYDSLTYKTDYVPMYSFKLLSLLTKVTTRYCGHAKIPQNFLDEAIEYFKIAHEGQGFYFSEYFTQQDYTTIARFLQKCILGLKDTPYFNLQGCPGKHEIVSVYNDSSGGSRDGEKIYLSYNHQNFDNHLVLSVVWNLVDLANAVCLKSFSNSYRMYHRLEQGMEKLFTRDLRSYWLFPNPPEYFYEHIFGPNWMQIARNLEKCIEVAYMYQATRMSRLQRPQWIPGQARNSKGRGTTVDPVCLRRRTDIPLVSNNYEIYCTKRQWIKFPSAIKLKEQEEKYRNSEESTSSSVEVGESSEWEKGPVQWKPKAKNVVRDLRKAGSRKESMDDFQDDAAMKRGVTKEDVETGESWVTERVSVRPDLRLVEKTPASHYYSGWTRNHDFEEMAEYTGEIESGRVQIQNEQSRARERRILLRYDSRMTRITTTMRPTTESMMTITSTKKSLKSMHTSPSFLSVPNMNSLNSHKKNSSYDNPSLIQEFQKEYKSTDDQKYADPDSSSLKLDLLSQLRQDVIESGSNSILIEDISEDENRHAGSDKSQEVFYESAGIIERNSVLGKVLENDATQFPMKNLEIQNNNLDLLHQSVSPTNEGFENLKGKADKVNYNVLDMPLQDDKNGLIPTGFKIERVEENHFNAILPTSTENSFGIGINDAEETLECPEDLKYISFANRDFDLITGTDWPYGETSEHLTKCFKRFAEEAVSTKEAVYPDSETVTEASSGSMKCPQPDSSPYRFLCPPSNFLNWKALIQEPLDLLESIDSIPVNNNTTLQSAESQPIPVYAFPEPTQLPLQSSGKRESPPIFTNSPKMPETTTETMMEITTPVPLPIEITTNQATTASKHVVSDKVKENVSGESEGGKDGTGTLVTLKRKVQIQASTTSQTLEAVPSFAASTTFTLNPLQPLGTRTGRTVFTPMEQRTEEDEKHVMVGGERDGSSVVKSTTEESDSVSVTRADGMQNSTNSSSVPKVSWKRSSNGQIPQERESRGVIKITWIGGENNSGHVNLSTMYAEPLSTKPPESTRRIFDEKLLYKIISSSGSDGGQFKDKLVKITWLKKEEVEKAMLAHPKPTSTVEREPTRSKKTEGVKINWPEGRVVKNHGPSSPVAGLDKKTNPVKISWAEEAAEEDSREKKLVARSFGDEDSDDDGHIALVSWVSDDENLVEHSKVSDMTPHSEFPSYENEAGPTSKEEEILQLGKNSPLLDNVISDEVLRVTGEKFPAVVQLIHNQPSARDYKGPNPSTFIIPIINLKGAKSPPTSKSKPEVKSKV